MGTNPNIIIGPVTRTKVPERYYPTVPTGKPVSPEALNSHLRFLMDNISDAQKAFQSITQRIQTNSASTGSVPASSSVQITVPILSPFPDLKYTATAGVVGTQLYVGDMVKNKNSVQVTVINRDTVNPHSGTVSVIVMHQ